MAHVTSLKFQGIKNSIEILNNLMQQPVTVQERTEGTCPGCEELRACQLNLLEIIKFPGKKSVLKSVEICTKNELKLTYKHLYC